MFYAAHCIGSYTVPVTSVTSSKIYWSACAQKLCYGIEVIDVSDESIAELERFHFDAAKQCQGLLKNTANYGALVTVGWSTLNAHCDIVRLLFFWRLLLMPMSCFIRRL